MEKEEFLTVREVAEWSTSTSQRHLSWDKKGPFKDFFHPQTPILQANGIEQLLGCRMVGNPWVNMAEKKHLTVREEHLCFRPEDIQEFLEVIKVGKRN
jgi:hypothetical protein